MRPLRFAVAAIVLALALPAYAQQAESPSALGTVSHQQLDVIKVLLAQERAWNNGDLDAFASAYKDAPDIWFITNAVSKGFAGLVDSYKHDYPTRETMGTLGFSEIEVKPLDERFAVVIGRYRLEREKKQGGNATGIFSVVMEKTDKGWKIIVDHTTG